MSTSSTSPQTAVFAKADTERRVVTGVVLDPYAVDLQNDWSPPSAVEVAAYNWLAKWATVGMEHDARLKGSEVVESYCFPYPAPEDYAAACACKPHRIFELSLGGDVVHSGSWVLSVRLPESAWPSVVDGSLAAFSIRGFGERTEVSVHAMPDVSVIRIEVPTLDAADAPAQAA